MKEKDIRNALLSTPIGRQLNSAEIDTLIKYSEKITFAPGELILQQGKLNDGMYVILDGTALVTAKILGEGGTYITTLGHGNLAGEVSLIEQGPAATSIIASTQVESLFITNDYFAILDLIYPDTRYKIIRAITEEICTRIGDLHNKITNFMSQSEMIAASMFSEVIKSLTKLTPVEFSEADLDIKKFTTDKFMGTFDEIDLITFTKNAKLYKAPKNCPLISNQDTQAIAYFIIRGAVQSSIIKDNKIAKLSVLGPNHLIANIALIHEGAPSIINYTTCERSLVLRITEDNLRLIRSQYKKLWYKFFYLICKSFIGLEHAADKLDVRLNSELYNR